MDRRTFLALALMVLVIVVTPMLFPNSRRQPARVTDTTHVAPSTTPPSATAAPATRAPTPGQALPATAAAAAASKAGAPATAQPQSIAPETTVVATARTRYALVSPGAAPAFVTLPGFRDLRPGAHDTVTLRQPSGDLLRFTLIAGNDTVNLNSVGFTTRRSGDTVTYQSTAPAVTLTYIIAPNGYLASVRGTVANAPAGAKLLVDLPQHLKSAEADTMDDMRHLAYGYRIKQRDVTSVPFSKLDSTVVRSDTGAMGWVAARNKYFLVALLRPTDSASYAPFTELRMRGGSHTGKVASSASATAVQPLVNGHFGFDLYAGPQSVNELRTAGRDLENVNPYGSFLRPVVQPFVTIVMRLLLWMKAVLKVNYGWVLVLFGIGIRLILWPLNQKAMRTSIRMQRIQPELAEVQKKYKSEPEKQREALVKLYQEHGMSPLSPMLGCLPMLLPMPILFALYYVFQNTIEFRGVPFLWLPDLSLRDPTYVIPLVMGASMFLLSWIGMRAAPPNPQAKMMSYMMPVMFTVMFLNFASGLNLYYAVQNIASLPQQWLLAHERAKAGMSTGPAPGKPKRSS